MRCWCGYLSGARCRLFAYGPADATAIPKLRHLLPHLNPDWIYLRGTGLSRLSWKRGPLNGRGSSSSSSVEGVERAWCNARMAALLKRSSFSVSCWRTRSLELVGCRWSFSRSRCAVLRSFSAGRPAIMPHSLIFVH